MFINKEIRVLLIGDNEKDYLIVKATISRIESAIISLDWISDIDNIFDHIKNHEYDICLMDYRLSPTTGLELMAFLLEKGLDIPFIFLTGYYNNEVDVKAVKSGGSNYLVKDDMNNEKIEHAIRYSIDRKLQLDAFRQFEQRLRNLSAKLLDVQEAERKRISQEIHDSTVSNLVAIKYGMESILERMKHHKPHQEGISIEQIIGYIEETIDDTRRIAWDLTPSLLDDTTLGAAIRVISQRYQKIFPKLSIRLTLESEEFDLPQHSKIIVFRVIQEALNNSIKHSKANEITIEIKKTQADLIVCIIDNGQGFDTAIGSLDNSETGLGLLGMRERINIAGGFMKIISRKRKGCIIKVTWPLTYIYTE